MTNKTERNKNYFDKLLSSFIKNIDINILFFIVGGLIIVLTRNQIIDFGNCIPSMIYIYLLFKVLWFDIPENKLEDMKNG